MAGIYQARLVATGRGMGEVRIYLEKTGDSGGYGYDAPCPEIAAEYVNRHPLNPGGLTYFRLVSATVDYVNRVFVPCELCLKAFQPPVPGLISWIDFSTDNQTEFISSETFTWGTWESTGGKFGGYRYAGTTLTVPDFQDRSSADDAAKQTTLAMWISNVRPSGTGPIDVSANAAGTGDGVFVGRASGSGTFSLISGSYDESIGAWPSGEWVSVIVTHDGEANQIKAWLNGTLRHTVDAAGINTNLHNYSIFAGAISTIYVYDYIFSDAERAAFDSMTSPIPIP